MAEEFKMPPMGQTSSSLIILKWHKQVGDAVKQGDVLAEVETDKATLDVESYLAGSVLKILRGEGETVDVGEPIAIIGKEGEAVPDDQGAGAASGESGGSKAAPPQAPARAASHSVSAAGRSGVAAAPHSQQATAGARSPGPGKVLASPVARKLAKERGIDLLALSGTGPGGRITKADVLASGAPAPAEGPAASAAVPKAGAAFTDRSVVARRVAASFQTIPHIYLTASADMSVAAARLSAAKAGAREKITYTHLVLNAIGNALQRNPGMNGVWDDSGTPRALDKSNVGLVVAGGSQLAIVTVDEPGRRSLAAVASDVNGAIARARSGSLASGDFTPCAVSVSNLGMFAVDEFQAIIDPDQTAMVSVARIADRVVAVGGAIAVRPMMTVTVAADHRVVDGVTVAQFLGDIVAALEAKTYEGGGTA